MATRAKKTKTKSRYRNKFKTEWSAELKKKKKKKKFLFKVEQNGKYNTSEFAITSTSHTICTTLTSRVSYTDIGFNSLCNFVA